MNADLSATLAAMNAGLNCLSAFALCCGFYCAKTHRRTAHKRFMIAAVCISLLFLCGYLSRVYFFGTHRYSGTGTLRVIYLVLLFSHMTLAVFVPPAVARVIFLAVKGRTEEHRKWVRFVWPIWIYVSITGVMVYWMLY